MKKRLGSYTSYFIVIWFHSYTNLERDIATLD